MIFSIIVLFGCNQFHRDLLTLSDLIRGQVAISWVPKVQQVNNITKNTVNQTRNYMLFLIKCLFKSYFSQF